MDRGERVADVEVGERGELADQQRLRLFCGVRVELRLEEGELLGDEAHVVEQEYLAVGEARDHGPGGRPADVVDELTGRPRSSPRTAACGSVEA